MVARLRFWRPAACNGKRRMHQRRTILLLNLAGAADHMFLRIFARAVTTIAADFGFVRWEDLVPIGEGREPG